MGPNALPYCPRQIGFDNALYSIPFGNHNEFCESISPLDSIVLTRWMADPASLVLGIAGLGGLFATCVQLFDLFEQGLQHGRSFSLILVKLKVERMRLRLWGEHAGIWSTATANLWGSSTPGTTHRNLQRQEILDVVLGVLGSMQALFEDAVKIAERYSLGQSEGLLPLPSSDALVATGGNFSSMVMAAGEQVRLQTTTQQRSISARKIMRWVFQDKSFAEKFVNDLRELNDSLISLVPSSIGAQVNTETLLAGGSDNGTYEDQRAHLPSLRAVPSRSTLEPNDRAPILIEDRAELEQGTSLLRNTQEATPTSEEPVKSSSSETTYPSIAVKTIFRQLGLVKE
jgi:Prion-inhibition and propagation